MSEPFNKKEEQELARLLRKVKENAYFWPNEELFNLKNEVVPCFAAELVIMRNNGSEIMLSQYEKTWKGSRGWWHMPGGYAKMDDTCFSSVCSRISKRELGVSVIAHQKNILGTYWWNFDEHDDPESRPLSIYAWAEPISTVAETKTQQFFNLSNLPSRIIGGAHRTFLLDIESYLAVARCKGLLK